MYAPVSNFDSTWGGMAKKFIESLSSVNGTQGFINSDLAEPYVSQDTSVERVELITDKIKIEGEETDLMTVDCQQKSPYFWYVVRQWYSGNSHGVKFGSAETFEELREIQKDAGVNDCGVFLDSGFRARSGEAEVYRNCVSYGELIQRQNRLVHFGWTPTKGFASRKRWKEKSGVLVPWHMTLIDPFMGTTQAGAVEMNLLEFSADYFKDIIDNLRSGRTAYKWSVAENMSSPEYWKHMDGEHKVTVINKVTGYERVEWRPRHRDWPNHGFDCEVLQIAVANLLGIFRIE
jgi:hypothetical protein